MAGSWDCFMFFLSKVDCFFRPKPRVPHQSQPHHLICAMQLSRERLSTGACSIGWAFGAARDLALVV